MRFIILVVLILQGSLTQKPSPTPPTTTTGLACTNIDLI